MLLSTLLAVSALFLTGHPGVHAAQQPYDCPAGTESFKNGNQFSCRFCPAGTFSVGGRAKCGPCESQSQPTSLRDACVPCPPNTFTQSPNVGCRAKCGTGYSNRNTANCYYEGCPNGFAVRASLELTTNGLECRACDPGAYVFVSGTPSMPSCVSCTASGAELNR